MSNAELWKLSNLLLLMRHEADLEGYNPKYVKKVREAMDVLHDEIISQVRQNCLDGSDLFGGR